MVGNLIGKNCQGVLNSGILRRLYAAGGLVLAAAGFGGAGQSLVSAQNGQGGSQSEIRATTQEYVETFYPLWFTNYQSQISNVNRIAGPDKVTNIYQIVVAINVDTIYASTYLDLTTEPVVLKVPEYSGVYSVLALDAYCNIFHSAIPSQSPGEVFPATNYVIYGPNFVGDLPKDVVPVPMPYNHMTLIFRADKFTPEGVDQETEAKQFRAALFTQPLCEYLGEPCPSDIPPGGATLILPEIAFSLPFKVTADTLIKRDAIEFLKQLQVAVKSPNTPPLSKGDQMLSAAFDSYFGDGVFHGDKRFAFIGGAQAGHEDILNNYLDNLGPNNWIHFTNIGDWGDNVLDRSSITEFIQYGNDIDAAAYYHTFRDINGRPLNGARNPRGYMLTFPPGGQPSAERFWSLTAYTPEAIELIDNPDEKYNVASYTPGLQTNQDGSVTVYMTQTQPDGVPFANWLPIPRRAFNIMLRVYGPEGSVSDNTYVPPGITRIR